MLSAAEPQPQQEGGNGKGGMEREGKGEKKDWNRGDLNKKYEERFAFTNGKGVTSPCRCMSGILSCSSI